MCKVNVVLYQGSHPKSQWTMTSEHYARPTTQSLIAQLRHAAMLRNAIEEIVQQRAVERTLTPFGSVAHIRNVALAMSSLVRYSLIVERPRMLDRFSADSVVHGD